MHKSISEFEIKSLSDDKRELEGWASTPKPDRVGDVIDPLGLTFQQEAPLLLDHKSDEPVGTVTFGQPTAKGLPFKAKIPKVTTPGVVKDRTDTAWDSVKHGLIKNVSIGFIPGESYGMSNGGTYFSKAEVHELSLTAVPCNPEATITAFKAADTSRASLAVPAQPPTQTKLNQDKDTNHMQDTTTANKNLFIRAAIAKAIAAPGGEIGFSETRWGVQSAPARYLKATVSGMTAGPDAVGALTAGTLSRQHFVQAVLANRFSGGFRGLSEFPQSRVSTLRLNRSRRRSLAKQLRAPLPKVHSACSCPTSGKLASYR